MKRHLCRLLGHRWNYCCRFAYFNNHLWCQRCKASLPKTLCSWEGCTFGAVRCCDPPHCTLHWPHADFGDED